MYRDAISFILLSLSLTPMLKSPMLKDYYEAKVIRNLTFYLGVALIIISTLLLNVNISDIVHTIILIILFIIFVIIFIIKMKHYQESINVLDNLTQNDNE